MDRAIIAVPDVLGQERGRSTCQDGERIGAPNGEELATGAGGNEATEPQVRAV